MAVSGTYTPMVIDMTGGLVSVDMRQAQYMRIKNIVKVSGLFIPDNNGGESTFKMTIPIESDFSATSNLIGIVAHEDNSWGTLTASVSDNKALVSIPNISNGNHTFEFTYKVI